MADLMETLIDIAQAPLVARFAYRRPRGECAFCDEHGADPMMPGHTPSRGCESGRRPHCTCDACY